MSAKIINGKELALFVREELKTKIEASKLKPGLAVVLVGNDAASEVYVRNKIKGCEEVGIASYSYRLPTETTQKELLVLINVLNCDKKVNGILVQLPLPKHISESEVLSKIDFEKDVDGFLAINIGRLALGEHCSKACTPWGCIKLIESTGVSIEGKNAVVIGRSNIVGKPVALMLLEKNATVTICHSKTKNLADIVKTADIVIAAVGKAKIVTADMIKSGAIVIDVGMNRVDGKLCGDVDFDEVSKIAGYITPVPGGVGPMTITMLLENTYQAALEQNG